MLGLSGVVEGCRRTGGGGKGGREREELSKVAKAVGDAKGWAAQAPAGLGRNSEEAPVVSATWRRLQEWSRGAFAE